MSFKIYNPKQQKITTKTFIISNKPFTIVPLAPTAPNSPKKSLIELQKLNTHYYDNKLYGHEQMVGLRGLNITVAEKIKAFDSLCEKIKKCDSKNIKMALKAVVMIKESIGESANFDNTKGVFADDILYLICKKENVSDYFIEQLADIMGGQCSQGRCTRLFQIFASQD